MMEQKLHGLKAIGRHVTDCLDSLLIQPGMTTRDIENQVKTYQITHNLENAQYGYAPNSTYHYQPPFPAYCCTSVNEVMCHGIPSDRILLEGDIVSVDVSFMLDGYYGDSCRTFIIGRAREDIKVFVEQAREATRRGVEQALPGRTIRDIGRAIEDYLKTIKRKVSHDFVGHSIGTKLHESIAVHHYDEKNALDIPIEPGLCLCIEPIIVQGKPKYITAKDGWSISTVDKSLSAQFETQVFITQDGQEIIAK